MKLALSLQHTLLIWLIGLSLATASYITVHHYETQKLEDHLESQLNNQVQRLVQSLANIERMLYATRAYLENGNRPSQNQFEAYFQQQADLSDAIQSVIWAPTVKLNQLRAFESKAQQQGLLGYQVMPSLEQHPPQPWLLPTHALPVLYLSSSFEGSDLLGLRLESDQNILEAVSRAIRSHQVEVAPLNGSERGEVMLVLGKYRPDGQIDGVVATKLTLEQWLGQLWRQEINSSSTRIEVFAQPLNQLIFGSHLNTELAQSHITERPLSASQTLDVPLFGQQWQVTITTIDRTGSTLMYGSASVMLILLLTVSATVAANFYSIRLRVSDQVIEEKTRSLAQQAIRDDLTNLNNRTALSQAVDEQLQRLKQGRSIGFSVMFIDLDRFKVVNDSMGHLHGDELLKQVAQRISAHCRDNDLSFRFGGDEFVICLPNLIADNALEAICHRYSHVLSQPYVVNNQQCHLGASIGVTIVTDASQTLAQILREADTAMYQAKSSSHEKVVFFHEKMFQRAKRRFTLEQELASAMALKQLSLVYQPIYQCQSDQVVGFESLIRWRHPKLGPISPEDFIPIAEETGLIIAIGDWVANECCKTLQRLWHTRQGHGVPRFNINVSAKQFESEHIYLTLQSLLDHYDFPAHLIGIEITESMLLSDECSAKQLARIKALGVTLYMDDFGTGFSSLAVLNDYPVDVIKVDRSFVSRIALGQRNADNLCQAIINMAHTIDLAVVAEGVETAEQLAFLTHHHCNYVQGYLKSPPVSVCQIERLLCHPQMQSA
ncbi:EAL domain-containing protein [Vibrio sp. JPW-9-11-11]|uniref:putative bifunctional diguanylate cyclase/phosphodiesterase n=1 Tax=Vibrio sp. JPW-9-11-11 TaxID=1416532 RepID=UPI001593EC86|nr:bifunctional diguanylate cyclase/phosphodiesterase [Vibrio sp. JPW-9-11-11]NVD08958.1 EAL domain-containing protein [Vibrio sp. JPW-9-11-11]